MAEAQGTTVNATQDKKGGAPVEPDEGTFTASGTSWTSKPAEYGNAAGEKINETIGPVTGKVGETLGTLTKPVGGVVDGVVGGVMRSGEAVGNAVGVVGSGNEKDDDS